MIGLEVDVIVLDVDDTLYLERDYVRSGLAHVDGWLVDHHGIEGVGETAWRLFEEGVRGTTIGDALARHTGEQALVADCVREYRGHRPDITMLPDAVDFIDRYTGAVRFAVVTDGPSRSQRAKCEALGLGTFCSPLVVTDELGTSKPDIRVFEHAVAGWDVPPGRIVYVADNPAKDFTGPRALGWQTLRLRRPMSLHENVPSPPDVLELRDLVDVRCA